MKTTFAHICFSILSSVLCLALWSCNHTKTENDKISFSKKEPVKPPVKIIATKPKLTLLDTCKTPEKINIPSLSFFNNKGELNSKKLEPSFVQSADFYIDMQNFNTEQGLALSSIICGFKDSEGVLWFGTSGNGLNMYDGTTFKTFNSSHGLIHNLIQDIHEDKDGILWIGTYGGLSKFDGASFENYTKENGLIDNEVNSVLTDINGRVWLGTSAGISCIENEVIINYNFGGDTNFAVYDIIQRRDDSILFATNKGLLYFNENAKTENAIVSYLKAPYQDFIGNLLEDKNGNLWLGTENGVYNNTPSEIKKNDNDWQHFTTENGLVNNNILSLTEDAQGTIWIGTENGISSHPLISTEKDTIVFTNITTQQGLANSTVKDITEDDHGNLWFSTNGGGVDKYEGQAVRSCTIDQGLKSNVISAIFPNDDESIWFGSFDGTLTLYDGKDFINYGSDQGLEAEYILDAIKDQKDNIWLATAYGLIQLSKNTASYYTQEQGLLYDYTTSILEDASGNLWIGSYEAGLNKFDGKTMTGYTTDQGLVHNTVWSSIQDKDGMLWFATRGGLSRFDGDIFFNFTKDQGLVENKLSNIFQDSKGNLIIGSWGSGVSIVLSENIKNLTSESNSATTTSNFITFNTNNGLANDVVYDIAEDSKGNIFIGSSKGVTVLKGGLDSSGKNIAKDGVENYNQTTGYPIKDLANNHSMYMDKDDVLWIGTGDKLVKFNYSEVRKSLKPPSVSIQKIKINNENLSWRLLQKAREKKSSIPNKQHKC